MQIRHPIVTLAPWCLYEHLCRPRHQRHVAETGLDDVQVGLEEYVAGMRADQKQIYYLSGGRPCPVHHPQILDSRETLVWRRTR